ncbi:MAG: hypothetical protein K9M98_12600 [Cephaloticoccus sp.]|nr:hypothetical protein [Cephaloticoccus sp.]MCF7761332.1 hypothetical protein [Cephaloticoccus sp.]
MKTLGLLAGFLCSLLSGCGGSGLVAMNPDIDIELINKSSKDLRNAEVHFGEKTCEWGNVGRTFTAIYLFYPHPITLHTELSWDEGGKHRAKKVDLSKIYPPGKSGQLTFTVYDDRVEVTFREQP